MAESISEGTLKTWVKKEGDTVAADEEVATIETDKVRNPPSATVPSDPFDTIPGPFLTHMPHPTD